MGAHRRLLGDDTMKKLVFWVLFVGLTACSGGGRYEPAPVVQPATGKELCSAACERMTQLTCAEADPVPAPADLLSCAGASCPALVACAPDAGVKECVSCEYFCAYQHDNGVEWNTLCIANLVTCAEIETLCNVQ